MDIVLPDPKKEKISPQIVMSAAREAKASGQLLCFINDYDYTVSDIHYGDGENPFLTRLFPPTASSLASMEERGAVIGAVSNRSGAQVSKRYKDQGIKNPFIIGTYGMELYLPDYSGSGRSVVDQRYLIHSPRITEILLKVRSSFYDFLKLPLPIHVEAETIERTALGEIYIENKGVCSAFPAGLSQVYNLNNLGQSDRRKLTNVLLGAYQKVTTIWEEMSGANLTQIWGVREFGDYTQKNYSWSLSPLLEEGKLFGVTKILDAIQKTHKNSIGFVLYGGDEDADAEAMIGLHNIEKLTERSENQKLSVFGAWINPGEERQKVKEASDIEINGVEGYSNFLNELSRAL